MTDDNTEALADLPPSAKLVHYVLRQNGPMTQQALIEESLLSPRTVRYGINRLGNLDILTERIHFKDTRQTIYETSVSDVDSDTKCCGTATTVDD